MPRFDRSFVDEVLNRASILDVVGRKVTWDKRKSNMSRGDMWACCPFHNETTPSFHAMDAKGTYHCFGCGVIFLIKIPWLLVGSYHQGVCVKPTNVLMFLYLILYSLCLNEGDFCYI